uniref:Uncharacterized protein n=1 Tax=Romanomermis culicivorax TaxID=13658 RepID=A0A915J342_ROMCU
MTATNKLMTLTAVNSLKLRKYLKFLKLTEQIFQRKDKFFEKPGTMSNIVETLKTLVDNLNYQSQIIIPTPSGKQKTKNKREIGSCNDLYSQKQ